MFKSHSSLLTLSLFILSFFVLFISCNGENEYHQTTVVRPSSLLQLIDGEGGEDSLVFITTESFTLTSTVSSNSAGDGEWCTYPDAFNEYNSKGANTIVEFHVPLHFTPNTTKHQRTVTFAINAGKYSASAMFMQDTIHVESAHPDSLLAD